MSTIIYPSPIFGPIHSRRLGVSLGINLLPEDGKVCTFDCLYCECGFNAARKAHKPLPTREEVAAALEEKLIAMKAEGIAPDVLTFAGNGEPTIHPELPELLRAVKALGYPVKLDTNGYRPQSLRALLAEGIVDYVAMDLKNSPAGYAAATGIPEPDLSRVGESITLLLESGVDFELRTTVVKPIHTAKSIQNMGQWLQSVTNCKPVPRLFVQPFVDRDTVPVGGLSTPTAEELELFREILSGCAESVALRGT